MLFELIKASVETLYMTIASCVIASLTGIPLGIILFCSHRENLWPHRGLNCILATIVNIVRSIPFIILMIAAIPLTYFIVGTSIGTTAAIVPLSLSTIPFIARLVEAALQKVEEGLIEAALSMGATTYQVIRHVLIPESLPAIVNGLTLTLITLVGYSAMAGAVGGGGLGALAINYGYQRFDTAVMIETVILLIVIVQVIQWTGDKIAQRLSRYR